MIYNIFYNYPQCILYDLDNIDNIYNIVYYI